MWLHFKKIDWSIVIIVLLLAVIGLITIYSIGSSGSDSFFKKQLLFVVFGFIVMIGLSFFDYRVLKNHTVALIILYIISLALLAAVLAVGQKVRGTLSWFKLGFFNFQPVELMKLVIVLILAKYFSFRHIEMYRIRHIVISGFYVFLPIILIYFQPDFGSVLVLLGLWMGMMLIAGIKIRHLLILGLIAVLIITCSWFWLLRDYHKNRIMTFINPQIDPYGHGYNIAQSLIAIGSGGLFGHGINQASQSQLNFLPEQQTDFIFATFAEEWGLAGIILILFLFSVLFWRMVRIALKSSNNFCRLYISGLIIIIFIQLIINIGMNMAILPVIGLNLPFLSYGGSSLLIIMIGLGLLQSMKVRS